MSDLFTQSGAAFSPCRTYRYSLWRRWDVSGHDLVFVMLNPSTADDVRNDPTVERCYRRAGALGYGGLVVLNAFAIRSTDPSILSKVDDPVGPENDAAFRVALGVRPGLLDVVCAWGKDGRVRGRDRQVLRIILEAGHAPLCLGTNADGTPRHPLYVPYEQPLVSYVPSPPAPAP